MYQGCISKTKKLPKLSSDSKADIEAFEEKVAATAAELQADAECALQGDADMQDVERDTGICTPVNATHEIGFEHMPNT